MATAGAASTTRELADVVTRRSVLNSTTIGPPPGLVSNKPDRGGPPVWIVVYSWSAVAGEITPTTPLNKINLAVASTKERARKAMAEMARCWWRDKNSTGGESPPDIDPFRLSKKQQLSVSPGYAVFYDDQSDKDSEDSTNIGNNSPQKHAMEAVPAPVSRIWTLERRTEWGYVRYCDLDYYGHFDIDACYPVQVPEPEPDNTKRETYRGRLPCETSVFGFSPKNHHRQQQNHERQNQNDGGTLRRETYRGKIPGFLPSESRTAGPEHISAPPKSSGMVQELESYLQTKGIQQRLDNTQNE